MLYNFALFVSLLAAILELKGLPSLVRQRLFYFNTFILMTIVMFNRFNSDYLGFQNSYYHGNPRLEIGYVALSNLLKFLNFPFESLLAIVGLLLFVVLIIAAKTGASSWIVLSYLIYPLALDLPQIRNYFMYLIVIISLVIWGNRSKIGVVAGILLGASMHILGLLYLPLTFILKKDRKVFFIWLKILFSLLAAGSIILRLLLKYYDLPEDIAEETDPFLWFYFMIQVVQMGIDLITIEWLDRKIKGRLPVSDSDSLELFYRFNWYTVLYLPLVALSTEMYRFRRNAQLVKYLFVFSAWSYLTLKERVISLTLIMINIFFVVGMLFYTGDMVNYTYLNENIIVYWLQGILLNN